MGVKKRKELLLTSVIEYLRKSMGGNNGIHKIDEYDSRKKT
jgi:hypothetical protein